MSPPPALEPAMPTAQRLVEEIRRELEAIEQEHRPVAPPVPCHGQVTSAPSNSS